MTGIFVEESPGLKMLDVGNGMVVGTFGTFRWNFRFSLLEVRKLSP